jgi:cation:H+ antiporter
MLLHWMLLLLSLTLLYFGAEWLVRGASGVASHFGVRPLIVGLVIVGFGTSMPEVVVSGLASLHHHSDTALGNVIGSNIANSGLILAVATLVRPMKSDLGLLRREGPFMLIVTIAVWLFAWIGNYSRLFGIASLLLLVIFMYFTVRWAKQEHRKLDHEFEEFEKTEAPPPTTSLALLVGYIVLGLAFLLGGGQALVTSAVAIARHFGVSEIVIAITLISIGTSVPELATSVVAALRGQGDISIGNVIGSNTFNLLGVLGLSATIRPIPVPITTRTFDMFWMTLFAVLTLLFLRTGRRLARWEGAILLTCYVVFLAFVIVR